MTYANLSRLIDRIAELEVLVIGEAMLDSYLEGSTGRLCREAPVPIVSSTSRTDAPGGAANTAVNVQALGARATLLSVVGNDPEAALLRQALADRGVSDRELLTQPGRRTLAKQRVIAAAQMLVRLDQGCTGPVDPAFEQRLLERLVERYPRCDAVIVSDYGYGILTPRVIRALAGLQARQPRVLVVDSKQLASYHSVGATAMKPNYAEAAQLLGLPPAAETAPRAEAVTARAEQLLDLIGAQIAAVTLDVEGALVVERGRSAYRTYARPTIHARAAGAGDTFLSALALALAAGVDTPAAAELASLAAAIVVAKPRTAACSARELRESRADAAKYLPDVGQLVARLELYRQQGRRIVFTNGCFDILHRGHITYLSRAKSLGDVLVVGLNSDDSVRRLKGSGRPINGLEDRAQVLAALSCVDHLVAFDEDTPVELIQAVRPDVFVKGGDYTRKTLPEASVVEELGGVVQLLPFLMDRSTSGIIERIRAVDRGPARSSAQHA